MADKVKITFEIDGIEKSVSSIDDLEKALQGVDDQAKKTEKTLEKTGDAAKELGDEAKGAGEAGEGAIKVMDEATGGLATKVKEVGGGLKAMGTQAISAFKGAVTGASAMGKALIATGIGAIVVALGLIVAYWDDIVGAVSGVSSDQKKLLADTEATAQANQESLDAISASENTLKLSGKSEKEIRDLKIQQTNETIAAMEAQLTLQKEQNDAQVAALERNKIIAQNVIRFLMSPISLLLGAIDALTYGLAKVGVLEEGTNLEEKFSGGIAGLIFDPESAREEADKTEDEISKGITKLQNQRDGYILQNKEANNTAVNERLQTEQELNAELERLRAENIADAEDKALKLLEIQRAAERQALVDKKASDELLKEFDIQTGLQRQEIVDQFAATAKAKKDADDAKYLANRQIIDDLLQKANLDAIEDQFERARQELEIQQNLDLEKLTLAGATADEINKINESYTNKSKKLADEEAKFKKALRKQDIDSALNASSQVLGSVIDLVGEGSAVGKAAAVAQTTIDTYSSATAAYKSVVGVPFVGPVLAPIAAGVATLAGVMSVKKILSTKVPGGKSTGGGSGPTAPSVPTFDPTAALGAAQETQTADNNITLGEQQGSTGATVVKAYVVSTDMSSQQEADKKINDLARL